MNRPRRVAAKKVLNYAQFNERGWQQDSETDKSSLVASSDSDSSSSSEEEIEAVGGFHDQSVVPNNSQKMATNQEDAADELPVVESDTLNESLKKIEQLANEAEREVSKTLSLADADLTAQLKTLETEHEQLLAEKTRHEKAKLVLAARRRNAELKTQLEAERKEELLREKIVRTDSAKRQSTPLKQVQDREESDYEVHFQQKNLKDLDYLDRVAERYVQEKLKISGDVHRSSLDPADYTSSTGRKEKSGLRQVMSESRIVNPQLCPQERLRLEHIRDPIKFDDLDLRLFVSGELNIIERDDISRVEKEGRMRLLKDILFLAGFYEWKGILEFYATVINQVELGIKSWNSSFNEERSLVLLPFAKGPQGKDSNAGSTNKKQSAKKSPEGSETRAWFCRPYQKGECSRQDPHSGWVAGRPVSVQHICAKCYLNDKKKAQHNEKNESCPYFSKPQ